MPPASSPFRRPFQWSGAALFVIPAAVRAYVLMPFPGSRSLPRIALAFVYHLDPLVVPLQILGVALMIAPTALALTNRDTRQSFRRFRSLARPVARMFAQANLRSKFQILQVLLVSSRKTLLRKNSRPKIGIALFCGACALFWYLTTFLFAADRMFLEPRAVRFASGSSNVVPADASVIGIEAGGVSKAYPVRYLAFHHQIRDSLGAQSMLVTYCSLCRSGRVFNPVIDGRLQKFRLIGAHRNNAVLEDSETRSWWIQASGEAVLGPRKGARLEELPSREMSLKSWTSIHPGTLVFQPDPQSAGEYDSWKTMSPGRTSRNGQPEP